LASVDVPFVVPFTVTEIPETGSPFESVTVPVTVWALAKAVNPITASKSIAAFLIIARSIIVWFFCMKKLNYLNGLKIFIKRCICFFVYSCKRFNAAQ
jgi:hypothetical protein